LRRNVFFIGLLALYGIVLFAVLTLPRIPLERMITGMLQGAGNGRVTVGVNDLDLAFPDRVRMNQVRYQIATAGTFLAGRVDTLEMRPDYGDLLRGRLPLRFTGTTPAGPFQGRMSVSLFRGSRNGTMSLHTDGFSLDKYPLIESALDRRVRGVLSGDVEIHGDLRRPLDGEGKGRLHMGEGAIEARLGLPGLDEIPFSSMEMAFVLRERVIHVSQAEMKGPAFQGSFTGEIRLTQDLRKSPMDLQGELVPGPMILDNAFLSPLLEKVLKGNRSATVRIRGTLERPAITGSRD